jgi:hypothetical protein
VVPMTQLSWQELLSRSTSIPHDAPCVRASGIRHRRPPIHYGALMALTDMVVPKQRLLMQKHGKRGTTRSAAWNQ